MPLPNGKNVSNLFPGGSKGHSSNGLSEKTITSSSDLYSTILGGLFFQMVWCILAVFTKVFLSPNPLFSKILQLTRNKGKSFFDRNIPHQNENHLLEIQISEVPERSNPQPKTYHLLVVPTTTSAPKVWRQHNNSGCTSGELSKCYSPEFTNVDRENREERLVFQPKPWGICWIAGMNNYPVIDIFSISHEKTHTIKIYGIYI